MRVAILFYLMSVLNVLGAQGINFDDLSCYRADIATITSAYFKEPMLQEIKELKVKNKSTGHHIDFAYLNARAEANRSEWIFAFVGIGTAAKDTHSKKISYFLRKSGYQGNILLIPSVFRGDFVQSFSRSGIVGNISQDVVDLQVAIDLVISTLSKREGKKFGRIDYIGFSLGALSAAHLSSKLKKDYHRYAPRKVFLMNSPVNLFKSLSRLDYMASKKVRFTHSFKIIESYIKGRFAVTGQNNAQRVFCELVRFDEEILNSFIANKLVSLVGNVFYRGQRRFSTGYFERRLGPLSVFADRREEREYWREAKIIADDLNFEEYVRYALIPSFNYARASAFINIEQLNQKLSMKALKHEIKKYPNDYYIVHSEDDFLLSSNQELSEYIDYFLPKHRFVVNRGGHLGLLNNSKVTDFIVKSLKSY